MKPKPVSIGRIVHYWSFEGDVLRPHAAIVVDVPDGSGRVFLHVFWATGFGGRDCLWSECAPFASDGTHTPTEGHWTWPRSV